MFVKCKLFVCFTVHVICTKRSCTEQLYANYCLTAIPICTLHQAIKCSSLQPECDFLKGRDIKEILFKIFLKCLLRYKGGDLHI